MILNIGLIGFGNAGRYYHLPILSSLPEFNIKAIFTTNIVSIEYLKKNFPNISIVDQVSFILNDSSIDLVIIATPNEFHFEYSQQALLANKHLIVEKPFTLNTLEADCLINLAKQQNKLLTVFHNRRFTSDFKTVKKIIDSKILGNIVEYEAHFDRFKNEIRSNFWKETDNKGAGILYDMGSHLIDQVFCLFGLPNEIFADLRIQRKGGKSIDNFELIFYYDNLKVALKASMLIAEARPQFSVYGENGCFIKYGMDLQESEARKGLTPLTCKNWGVEPKIMWGKITTHDSSGDFKTQKYKSEKGDYRTFYKNIYNHLTQGEELIVKPIEAKNVIKAIEFSIKSNKEKKIINWH